MSTRRTLQFILGYGFGALLFLCLVPFCLYRISQAFDHLAGIHLIPNGNLRVLVAFIMLAIGLLFGIWSNVVQNTIGQGGPFEVAGFEFSPKTQHLVVTGPYRFTRNPMLFGACLAYYAIAIYLDSIFALAAVAFFITFMLILVKLTEEPRLLKDFGSDYQAYRQRVSMFVPWFPKRPVR